MNAAIGLLEATPGILRSMLAGASEQEAGWKPDPKRWSILEVLGHLCHVEKLGFRARVERMTGDENPRLESYDPDGFAAAGAYSRASLADALDEFQRERTASLAYLKTLPADAASRTGDHAELGPVTVNNLVHEWPFHDLGHVRQIAELLRAVKFYPHMGAWQKFYTIHP